MFLILGKIVVTSIFALPGGGRTGLERHGQLDTKRLAWLQAHLDTTTPTVIAMHHPPFATGITHMDKMGLLRGAAELESILRRHHNIERIVCGHLHRSIQARFANSFASTCPSPAHQLTRELNPDRPASCRMEPPGYQLHLWRDGRLITRPGVFGAFPGPLPFDSTGGGSRVGTGS